MSNNNALSNIVIERLVLGAILQSEDNYWTIAGELSIDSFSTDAHQKIFATMQQLAMDSRSIRVPLLAGRIGGEVDGESIEAYLSMLLHMVTRESSLPLEDYAYELKTIAMRRRIIELSDNLRKTATDPAVSPDRIIERAAERLSDIASESISSQEATMSSVIRDIIETAGSANGGNIALRPCLLGLEEMVGFYPPGSLVLWGGGPGSGKTAMAMQQIIYTGREYPSYLFELEMDGISLIARSLSGQTGVPVRDVMRGLSENQLEKFMEIEKGYNAHNLKMLFKSPVNIDTIKFTARSQKRRRGLRLLVVDHLKLIERHSRYRMDPVERAYQNARDLKQLAQELGCVVVALCQFTKSARQKEIPEPEMEDFYGGSLEEHADIMLANFNRYDWLVRNPPRTNQSKAREDWDGKIAMSRGKIEVYKLKDRFGKPRDRRIFKWDGEKTLYYDLDGVQDELLLEGASL